MAGDRHDVRGAGLLENDCERHAAVITGGDIGWARCLPLQALRRHQAIVTSGER